ncbi:hypothetical protein E5163_03170 [Marinicauda algicola]|uniref:Uncharacterized protein n=1 Tax=Marinicauda algicola TaxID=2029849 RepID=A0A4S2H3P9_9PROT|nr:hypothetical protein [Marinicauda algicola]TGY90143.1 hypothetical protein E5163_03170 [Marinicauda algicola]
MARLRVFAWGSFIGLCLALVALGFALPLALRPVSADAEPDGPAQPGMAILQDFPCHRAETKQIFVRGVEDGFSIEGREFGRLHPRLENERTRSVAFGPYDQVQADRILSDYFELPSNISSGVFVTRLRPVSGNGTDTLSIGDVSPFRAGERSPTVSMHRLTAMAEEGTWTIEGDLHSARFEELRLQRYRSATHEEPRAFHLDGDLNTILDYVRSGDGVQILDVWIGDDTAVDFIGVAVCEEPPREKGVSLVLNSNWRRSSTGASALGCDEWQGDHYICDPYLGDTPCETAQPLLCFFDLGSPVPAGAEARSTYEFDWSGGVIATTPDVRGDSFRTISEADAYCSGQFGEGWRTARYHDGLRPGRLSAFGGLGDEARRVWVDIMGQPYSTCWTR